MLTSTFAAAPRLLGALTAARGLATSAATGSGTPTYTYASPGTSMTEPSYFGGAGVGSMEEPASRPSPTKKARILKVLSSKTRKLAAQGGGGMLPPGCSISDPSYSLSDPVYFVDNSSSKAQQ